MRTARRIRACLSIYPWVLCCELPAGGQSLIANDIRRMHGSLVATGFGLKFLSPFGLFCGLASLVSGIISYSQRQDVMRYDTLKAVRPFPSYLKSRKPTLFPVPLPHGTQARHLRFPVFGSPFQSSQGHVPLEHCSPCTSDLLHPLCVHWNDTLFRARLLLYVGHPCLPVQASCQFLPLDTFQKHSGR